MEEISLQQLLEAGCHFGHKSERWHPHASEFIYTEKDGIHIIDLVKTKAGLEKAAKFVRDTVAGGGEIIFVATKRQAKGVVKEAVLQAGAPYFVERWIGGFLTNWDEIKKNITKANRMAEEEALGAWKKFPKHEQVKMSQHLKRLNLFYGGVLSLKSQPAALFIVDVKKEIASVREAKRREFPIIAIVDTNSDPRGIDYVIPANDDAVGSVKLITDYICAAYAEGMKMRKTEETPKATEKPEKKEKIEIKRKETKEVTLPEIITGIDVKTKIETVVEDKPKKVITGEKAKVKEKAPKKVRITEKKESKSKSAKTK